MFAGIDTHKDTLAVAVVDRIGSPLAVVELPNTRPGFIAIAALLSHHQVQRVGIEGSGNYGRCIAAYLVLDWDHNQAVEICEVPTLMTSRERRSHPSKGKTDPVDAPNRGVGSSLTRHWVWLSNPDTRTRLAVPGVRRAGVSVAVARSLNA